MTQNSIVTWIRQDASWSQTSVIEIRSTDETLPDTPYAQGGDSSQSITYTSSNPSVASINWMMGNLTLGKRAGSTVITASVTENEQSSAASASYTLIVYDPAAQITLTNPTPSVKVGQSLTLAARVMSVGVDTGFPFSAQNKANNYFSYAVGKAGDDGEATINRLTGNLTASKPGLVTVTVTLHSTRQYTAMSAEFVVAIEDVLNWASPPVTSINMGEIPPVLKALHSGSTPAVEYGSTAEGVAKIDPSTGVITLFGPGTTTISAALNGGKSYNTAYISYVLTVNRRTSVLNWSSTPTTSFKIDVPSTFTFAVSHSGSTGAVVYRSDDSNVVAIDPTTGAISLEGAGSTTIHAELLEDGNYQGVTISYPVDVAKGDSALSWLGESITSITMGETLTIPQVSHSGSTAIRYSSSNTNAVTIDEFTGAVKLVGAGDGSVTISVRLIEDANYQAALAPISCTFKIFKGDSTLSWDNKPAAFVNMGELPAFTVVRSGSKKAIVYTSTDTDVAKITPSGNVVLRGPGSITIKAELQEDNDYNAAPAVITYDMVVSSGDASVSLLYGPFFVYVDEKLTLVPVTKSNDTGNAVVDDLRYQYTVGAPGDTGTADIDPANGVLTGKTSGAVTVTVTCTSNNPNAWHQITGTQCTVNVLESGCTVSVPNSTMTIKLGGSNDPSYQITPTTMVNGVIVLNGAPYKDTTYDFAYSYELSTVSPDNSVTLSSNGFITGTHFGAATITVKVTFTTPAFLKSASTTLLVSFVEGDSKTPRPTNSSSSYPTYTGNEPPQLAAVQALLDDLMPLTEAQTHDDSDSTAAQLFGLDLSYFENIKPDGKKIVFSISEANNIYRMSCTATSHLRLKATKELVLGDNISFTVTRGNSFSLSVNLNNKDDQFVGEKDETLEAEPTDKNSKEWRIWHDAVQADKAAKKITGHGVINTTITGVAAELELGAYKTYDDSLYSYQEDPATTDTNTNFVYLPKLNKVKLDYGRVNSSRRDRVVKLEFIGPGRANKNSAGRNDHDKNNGNLNTLEPGKRHPYSLKPEECAYAEFTQITKDGFKPYKGPSKGITGKGRGNPSILPEEGHLGLLGDYFYDETNGGKAMGDYDTIDLPDYVVNDEFLDTTRIDGGVNFLQFRKGKGRLRHEYMDNTIKMLQKAKAIFNINIAGGIRDFFVSSVISELDFSGTMICHSWISPVGFNHGICVLSMNTFFAITKATGTYAPWDCRDYLGELFFQKWFGPTVNLGVVETKLLEVEAKQAAQQSVVNAASNLVTVILNTNEGVSHQLEQLRDDQANVVLKNTIIAEVKALAHARFG